jgi:hypothetical protein
VGRYLTVETRQIALYAKGKLLDLHQNCCVGPFRSPRIATA